MAKIKIATVIERLERQMRDALEAAVKGASPGVQVDRQKLFRAFVRAIERKCSTWEKIPDNCVKNE